MNRHDLIMNTKKIPKCVDMEHINKIFKNYEEDALKEWMENQEIPTSETISKNYKPPHVDKIKIGGITYKIEEVKRLEENNQPVWGLTQYENARILIRDQMDNQKYYQTLIHEALHGMLHEAGVDNLAEDESLVTPLGNMIYQFIKDNPRMVNNLLSV